MNLVKYVLVNIVETLLRMFPFPCKTGMIKIGNPDRNSPVFLTCNFHLTVERVKQALKGMDCYLLVANSRGINVWCAAGKGTFGTDELVYRIEITGLRQITDKRRLILPQLGAPGVSAHEVKKRSGFNVEYGPVRANDIPEYLKTKHVSREMRKIRFDFIDRLILTPVELKQVFWPMVIAAVIFYFLSGFLASTAVIITCISGAVLFPVLLPWLPSV